jgi:nicotinamidase-related amidase
VGHNGLLIVDVQHGLCDRDGSLAATGVDVAPLGEVVGACRTVVDAARARAVPVVHATTELVPGSRPPGSLGAIAAIGGLAPGTWDAAVVEALAPRPTEPHVRKHRWNAFFGTPLDTILLELGVEDLVVIGVRTNLSIQSTVRDAAHREYRVTVVADANADVAPDDHRLALESLGWAFATVASVDDVLQRWSAMSLPEVPG